jgi:hypothetical protein
VVATHGVSTMRASILSVLLIASALAVACGDGEDDASDNEAVRRGVGAACTSSSECTEEGQVCLTQFKGGMCGIADCTSSSECPTGSVCVADPDLAQNFCLLVCDMRTDCNVHRPVDDEANCSSTLNAIDEPDAGPNDPKVCRPPSA